MLLYKEQKYIMKNLDFLTKIKHEKKLELVELSEQLSKSYTEKSRNCLLNLIKNLL